MIDRGTGALALPGGRIERGLTLSALIASPLGQHLQPDDMGTGWVQGEDR